MKGPNPPVIDYKLYAYALVSLALAMPVIIWPLILYRGVSEPAYALIVESWMVSVAVLLMVSTAVDSVLAGVRRMRDLFSVALWIVGMSMLVSYAMRVDYGSYLLATAFGIHSLRTAYLLWSESTGWWMWPAWIRDVAIAASLFGWLLAGVV